MYSSQPFKVKCHLDCESCLVVRLDSHLQRASLGRHSALLNSYRAAAVRYTVLTGIECWIDVES